VLGAGFRTHATCAAWPVICRTCAALTTANHREAPLVCSQCKSDDVVRIADARAAGDDDELNRWEDLTLTNGHYLCPKCNVMELRFARGVIDWD
jgi:hypothetical protein